MPRVNLNGSQQIIDEYLQLLKQPIPPATISKDGQLTTLLPSRSSPRNCALLFSAHPDDECLTGGLALRLKNEQNWQIINIAVTLGSKIERRAERKKELAGACSALGFDCVLADKEGFSNVNSVSRECDPAWGVNVARIAEIIENIKPQAIFFPHAQDWHETHIGTYWLVIDALARLPENYSSFIFQTEYWHPLADPNLLIGLSAEGTSVLLAALSCHAGEVSRNPYDRFFPSYLIDNARRGGEQLKGKGALAESITFALLYKMGLWKHGKFFSSALNRIIPADHPIGSLFE